MAIIIQRNYINCKLDGDIPDHIFQQLRTELRYAAPGFHFSFVAKRGWGDGYVYLITPKRRVFPSGLLSIVEDILQQNNLTYTINDLRIEPIPSNPIPLSNRTLRDYQQNAEQKCLENKCGVLKMPTGSGKTLVFTSLLGKLNGLKRAIYVRKLDLMQQTIRCLADDLGLIREEIGEVGGGKVYIKDLSVIMIPTAARVLDEKYVKYAEHDNDDDDDNTPLDIDQKLAIKEFIENADCFIIDECHCVSSETAQMVSRHSKKAYYRIGCSATPWRTDGTDILINAATGPKLIDISASDLIKRGFLVPPRVHFYKMKRDWKQLVPNDYQKVYTQYIVENKERNQRIVDLTDYLVSKGERPVILVQRQQHGKILEEMLTAKGRITKFIYGESCMTDRAFTIEQFKSGALDVLIGSTILNEGIDIQCITALINAAGGKSSSSYYQKIGRAIRVDSKNKGKTRAVVIDFIDEVKYLDKHSKERIKVLQVEPLYEVRIKD